MVIPLLPVAYLLYYGYSHILNPDTLSDIADIMNPKTILAMVINKIYSSF